MTTFTYLPARSSSRDLQPRVRFGSSFAGSGFNTFGTAGDSELRNKPEQLNVLPRDQCCQGLRGPGRPDLYRMFETQFPRLYAGTIGRLRHEYTNEVVGEQIDPQLLFNHLGTHQLRVSMRKVVLIQRRSSSTFQRFSYSLCSSRLQA